MITAKNDPAFITDAELRVSSDSAPRWAKADERGARPAYGRLTLFVLRLSLGWIFLWASIHHYGNGTFVEEFLDHTKTFHALYAGLARPPIVTVISPIVEYGQILIAGSLILGLFFRIGVIAGSLLLMLYWTANMNFPYITSVDNFIVDEHLIFALVLILLGIDGAGHLWGIDGTLSRLDSVRRNAFLRWCTA